MKRTPWGVDNVEEEFSDLIKASEASKQVKHPWRSIVTKKYRPQFVMSILIPFFQQLTGINAIIFYAPVLFQTFGYGGHAFLMSVLPLITALVSVLHSIIRIQSVDRDGRSLIFYHIGIRMVMFQVNESQCSLFSFYFSTYCIDSLFNISIHSIINKCCVSSLCR